MTCDDFNIIFMSESFMHGIVKYTNWLLCDTLKCIVRILYADH